MLFTNRGGSMNNKDHEVTWTMGNICVCNNCGAFADKPEKINHFKSCQPGSAKRWEEYYQQEEEV